MTATHVRTQYYLLELTELIPSVELVLNVNQITHRIELELELMPKNHQNPSPDSDPALELIQPYSVQYKFTLDPTPVPEALHMACIAVART